MGKPINEGREGGNGMEIGLSGIAEWEHDTWENGNKTHGRMKLGTHAQLYGGM